MVNSEPALQWIVEILKRRQIPFAVSGGLAARLYGATRPLYDIDIDIPNVSLIELSSDPEITPFITFGPERVKDEEWDLLLCTLVFKDQSIDLSGADDCRLYNHASGEWIDYPTNLNSVTTVKYIGLQLPLITKQALIDYKKHLARETDLIDVAELEK
jgi:hypothetical protein